MTVTGQVIGTERRDIEPGYRSALRNANVATRAQGRHPVESRLGNVDLEPARITQQLLERRRNTVGAIVEQRQPAIRTNHRKKPRDHASGNRSQPRLEQLGRSNSVTERTTDVYQVEHVLERQCVIHRAALELPTVGQDLFAELTLDD